MGIQERAMLEYRRTMKKARGMTAVLGLCMAVAGTSVSYASASGNTGDSGYESSQEHTESAGADTGGSSFEAGDSLGDGSGGGSGGGGSRRREAILASAVWIQSQAFLKQRAVPEAAAQRQKQVILKQRTAPETAGKTKKTKTQNPGILPVRAVRRQKTAVMINQQRPVRKLLSEPGRRKTVRQPEM